MPATYTQHEDLLVNTTTLGQQSGGQIARLSDGGHVVVWVQSGSGAGVFAQRYAADGSAVGGEFRIDEPPGSSVGEVKVAALPDGGFVAAWASGAGLRARTFDANGVAVGGDQTLTSDPGDWRIDLAAQPDGGFLTTFLHEHWDRGDPDTADDDLYLGYYVYGVGTGGAFDGQPFLIGSTPADASKVVRLANGDFIVAWTDPSFADVMFQRVSASGALLGSPEAAAIAVSYGQGGIAALNDGGFLLTWTHDAGDGTSDIYQRRYDASGAATGPATAVSGAPGDESAASVTALSDGGWLVTWTSGDLAEAEVMAQRFAADGSAVGGAFQVNTGTAGTQAPTAVIGGQSGGFTVVYDAQGLDSSSYGVATRTFDAYSATGVMSGAGDTGQGTAAGETIQAGGGGDTVAGLAGADTIFGGAGDDALDGGSETDALIGEDGGDELTGGLGDDWLVGGVGGDDLVGDDGADTLYGDDGSDWLSGGIGADALIGGGDGDTLHGGDGADWLTGGAGDDDVYGDADDDNLFGGDGDDWMVGGLGNDAVIGQAGVDHLEGGDGDDWLVGEEENDTLDGGDGVDQMYAGQGADRLFGGAGTDSLFGNEGDDTITGDAGADALIGDDGDDDLYGGADNDWMVGGIGADALIGDDGDDQAYGGEGADWMVGGAGSDALIGEGDDDSLFGEGEADWIVGGLGSDTVQGGDGDDFLFGDEGQDWLTGGAGADTLTGGAGADRFLFGPADTADAVADLVSDFTGVEDLIDLSAIDADANTAGDQAFTVVDGFTGTCGQAVLTFDAGTGNTTLALDLDGNGTADWTLLIGGRQDGSAGFLF